ncbi:MAG: NUDIX hydrolase [Sphaerospermopsis sp. SIO1G2]|nr:NUDIX hydrolase [Sphaerospermopsis sp. SIO1G1]NET73675.1 NUDIX hydrolase [Sphaerospermopsis sp. SIO1G2]
MKKKTKKIYKQSGVIPYRIQDGKIQVLLISTRKSQRWVIPKGGICKGMTPPDSAAKEAWEEAGVIGQVKTEKIGAYKYRKQGNVYRVNLFWLPVEKVLEDWPEAGERSRIWLDIHHAAMIVQENSLKKILQSSQNQMTEMII